MKSISNVFADFIKGSKMPELLPCGYLVGLNTTIILSLKGIYHISSFKSTVNHNLIDYHHFDDCNPVIWLTMMIMVIMMVIAVDLVDENEIDDDDEDDDNGS